MRKSFKKNPAELFISSAADPEPEAKASDGYQVPEGFRIIPDLKSERVQLLLRPGTKAGIKRAAEEDGVSMNDLVNTILENYLKERKAKQ